MAESLGFWNKVLHVNLTDRTFEVEEPGPEFFRKYGGGRGMIAHYLLKYVPKGADPLGPDNVLVFAPGVVTGATVPGAGRHSVGAKSPLTGGFGEAEAGGFWGAEVKRAGWDGIVVHGAASSPVYLWLNGDRVQIRDASHLWGHETGDVQTTIREELEDEHIRVAQCGIAGENLVRFAIVGNDLMSAAGRTGMGAVMGSKKLKAIAVRGNTPIRVADRPKLLEIARWVSSTVDTSHRAFHEFGTGGNMQDKSLNGGLPTMNWRLGAFETVQQVDAVAVADQVRVQMDACYACSVRCKKVVQIERIANGAKTKRGELAAVDPVGRWSVSPEYGGPEYETLASFGPNLGVDDLVAVCKSHEICNSMGMDTISAGSTLAWAMEAYEKGVLTDEDTGGFAFRFRDPEGVVRALEMIARREGVGDLLAEGSAHAAARLGRGSDAFLSTVKNLEAGMHDPRHMERMRESMLLSPTGADHTGGYASRSALNNQVGLCNFLQYNEDQRLDILNAVTGWGLTQDDKETMARRGLTLTRLYNGREGLSRADDTMPQRFREDLPMHSGVSHEEILSTLTAYYTEQGWDPETGDPTEATIKALDLEEDAARARA